MRRITATLTLHRHQAETRDRRNNPIAAPVEEWPVEEWPVYSAAPATAEEPFEGNRDPRILTLTVTAPLAGPRPRPLDKVTVPVYGSAPFEVVGEAKVWDHNPHVHRPRNTGISLTLERRLG